MQERDKNMTMEQLVIKFVEEVRGAFSKVWEAFAAIKTRFENTDKAIMTNFDRITTALEKHTQAIEFQQQTLETVIKILEGHRLLRIEKNQKIKKEIIN
jgi:exonuclease VII small subunit